MSDKRTEDTHIPDETWVKMVIAAQIIADRVAEIMKRGRK